MTKHIAADGSPQREPIQALADIIDDNPELEAKLDAAIAERKRKEKEEEEARNGTQQQ